MNPLLKYFQIASENKDVSKKDILSGTEALKQFAKIDIDYKADLFTLLTIVEYEFTRGQSFSSDQFRAIQAVLASVALFFSDCRREYESFLEEQKKQTESS